MKTLPKPRKVRRATLCNAVLACLICAQLLCAQTVAPASDVEAAYLFNFGKFMRTQRHSGTHFTICLLGVDPFGSKMAQLTSRETIDGRPMRTMAVAHADDARSCDILFLGEPDQSRMESELKQLSGYPVLTVSSTPGFLEQGGMIEFVVQQDHVRFRVNLEAVTRSNIQLSSQLLKVAVSVTGGHGENHP